MKCSVEKRECAGEGVSEGHAESGESLGEVGRGWGGRVKRWGRDGAGNDKGEAALEGLVGKEKQALGGGGRRKREWRSKRRSSRRGVEGIVRGERGGHRGSEGRSGEEGATSRGGLGGVRKGRAGGGDQVGAWRPYVHLQVTDTSKDGRLLVRGSCRRCKWNYFGTGSPNWVFV